MKYTVFASNKTKEFDGKWGKMFVYTLSLIDSENKNYMATLAQKSSTPAPSGEIEGEIIEGKYGPEFKKAEQSNSGSIFSSRTPADQNAIIRQHSLGQANTFILGRAGHMEPKKALELITKENIVALAHFFEKYSAGEMKFKDTSEKVPTPEPEPEEVKEGEEEINLNELPWEEK